MTPHHHPINPSWYLRLSRRSHIKSVAAQLYIRMRPNVSSILIASAQLFIIFKITTIAFDVSEEIAIKIDLFSSIMQQSIIKNDFNGEYVSLATIQQGALIKYIVKSANDLYLDLNTSRLHVLANNTKADTQRTLTRSGEVQSICSALDVSRDFCGVKRTKCERHEPALTVPRIHGDSGKLQQWNQRQPSPVRELDNKDQREHGCYLSRRSQIRSERYIFENYRGRANQSVTRSNNAPRLPNVYKNQSPIKVDPVCGVLCVQFGTACMKCSAAEFQSCNPKGISYDAHQIAYQHGNTRLSRSFSKCKICGWTIYAFRNYLIQFSVTKHL